MTRPAISAIFVGIGTTGFSAKSWNAERDTEMKELVWLVAS